MRIDGILLVLAGYLVQATCAGLIAAVLAGFRRIYRRRYLRDWERSWWAFSAYLGCATLGLLLYRMEAPEPLRLAVAALATVAGLWQLAWLARGVREVTAGRRPRRRYEGRLLAALAALGLLAVLVSTQTGHGLQYPVRIGFRVLLAGGVFLMSGWRLLRNAPGPGLGQRMLGASFLLYGLEQLHYVVILILEHGFGLSFAYPLLLGGLDVVFQAAMGMGMVVALLEEERKRVVVAAEQIEHLAYHDTLTGLPNRALFLEHARITLARAARERRGIALMFLDLDRFKTVNDSLGHACGDEVLRITAERLRGALRQADTVARLSGDEFAILLSGAGTEDDLARLAEKLLTVLRQPVSFQGRRIVITASLGISHFPEQGAEAADLLRKADVAMYKAKRDGRDVFRFYDPGLDAHARDRASLEGDLREAVRDGGLMLFYQPIFEARTRRIAAVETLLRWQHPGRGLLGPTEFLPLAEQSGLSLDLDLWVLRTACAELVSWGAAASRVRLGVNLSARPYRNPELADLLAAILEQTGLAPERLELEVTETMAMQNAEVSLGVLRRLKELGVQVSLDDFGTGYSSLSYLHDFPIDSLKIDSSFVRLLGTDRSGAGIPTAMITLAHGLKVRIVAEGVETEEQLAMLREQGCDEVQGYLLSPPLPAAECRRLVLEPASSDRGERAVLVR